MRVSSVSGSLLLLSLASVVCGAPQALKLRQSVASPRNWVDLGRASRTHVIPLRIALPQPRFPELEQHLAEISDPSHARYGEHLSKADVEELVTPHASSVDAVYGWLESPWRAEGGVSPVTSGRLGHRERACRAGGGDARNGTS
jgi:tripeptidyl-peptidase-1